MLAGVRVFPALDQCRAADFGLAPGGSDQFLEEADARRIEFLPANWEFQLCQLRILQEQRNRPPNRRDAPLRPLNSRTRRLFVCCRCGGRGVLKANTFMQGLMHHVAKHAGWQALEQRFGEFTQAGAAVDTLHVDL